MKANAQRLPFCFSQFGCCLWLESHIRVCQGTLRRIEWNSFKKTRQSQQFKIFKFLSTRLFRINFFLKPEFSQKNKLFAQAPYRAKPQERWGKDHILVSLLEWITSLVWIVWLESIRVRCREPADSWTVACVLIISSDESCLQHCCRVADADHHTNLKWWYSFLSRSLRMTDINKHFMRTAMTLELEFRNDSQNVSDMYLGLDVY